MQKIAHATDHAIRSLRNLIRMPNDTIVYPGHGLETTIGREKRTRAFVGAPAGYIC